MFFGFQLTCGLMLVFYGYSVMKNPRVWGDQGRDEINPENWNGYVVHNGQFMMYAGFFLAALAALDVIFDFAGWLYILILLGGLALAACVTMCVLSHPAVAVMSGELYFPCMGASLAAFCVFLYFIIRQRRGE